MRSVWTMTEVTARACRSGTAAAVKADMRSTLLALFALSLAACGGSRTEPAAPAAPAASAAPAPAASAPLVPPGEAKIGDKTTCLISKEEFVVTASSPRAEYEGKTYYFCCAGCDKKFLADPKKYLSPGQ
jgi:Cu+-exporting ATPase